MRAKPFFRTRFRVKPVDHAEGDHWQCGPTTQKGADCPACKRPLLLVWDINTQDSRLLQWNKTRFGPLPRLPLFFCWACVGDLSYSVVSGTEIRVIRTTGVAGMGGTAYEEYPSFFPRRPLELSTEVPDGVRRAIGNWGRNEFEPSKKVKEADLSLLPDFFGHSVDWKKCMVHHQFGGSPLSEAWDDEAFLCPNGKCPGGLFDQLLRKPRAMKFLAGVLNDPPGGLPMIEPLDEKTRERWDFSVSVQFHMCDKCFAVTAANRCS